MTDGRAAWKTVPFSLKGAYNLYPGRRYVRIDAVYGDATDLTVTGSLGSQRTALRFRGSLDPGQRQPITPLPFKAGGSASIDVGIEEEGGILKVHGALDLADLSYEIPNVMTKAKGIANTAHFDLSRENEVFHITRLTYNLGSIDADVKGDCEEGREDGPRRRRKNRRLRKGGVHLRRERDGGQGRCGSGRIPEGRGRKDEEGILHEGLRPCE